MFFPKLHSKHWLARDAFTQFPANFQSSLTAPLFSALPQCPLLFGQSIQGSKAEAWLDPISARSHPSRRSTSRVPTDRISGLGAAPWRAVCGFRRQWLPL
jgi:hypothetical protein